MFQLLKIFNTFQSQIILFTGLFVLFTLKRFTLPKFLATGLVFLSMAYHAECLVKGQCRNWSWLYVLATVMSTHAMLTK